MLEYDRIDISEGIDVNKINNQIIAVASGRVRLKR